ncbi:zinc finger domain-containing protein [Modicisalibacter xianhensis]|uniref:zinc finger domain-containing protein n=1 Tax=Modicisalibacter xianhensis TaxID=442341 RepID=UPI003BF4D3CD
MRIQTPEVIRVPCPYCEEEAGKPCRTKSGELADKFHVERCESYWARQNDKPL